MSYFTGVRIPSPIDDPAGSGGKRRLRRTRAASIALSAAEEGADAELVADVRTVLAAHGEELRAIRETSERDLFFRKIATGAAIAGALFAAVRLTDIWLAVKRGRPR